VKDSGVKDSGIKDSGIRDSGIRDQPKLAKYPYSEAAVAQIEKVQTQGNVEVAVNQDSKPNIKPEMKAETKIVAKTEAKTEAKAETKVVAKTEAKTEAKAEAKVEPKTEAKVEAKAEVKTEARTEAIAEVKAETKPKAVVEVGDDEVVAWLMPAKGKLIGEFSESANRKGIDIAGSMGQPVFASAPGKVVYSGSGLRGYGKLVIIKHNKTFLSAYAHNSQILVKEGQAVTSGQKIAEMGNSDTDQVKLHFEVRRFGKPVDPAKYLPLGKS
jgi:lipoprotein NlpD